MANLAVKLSRQLERPVIDRTGLSGKYDFRFDWTPDTGPCPNPSAVLPFRSKVLAVVRAK